MEVSLDTIRSPADLRGMSEDGLRTLASDIRREMLECVSRNGGHLASSLGAVELSIALLRVFDPEKDRIVWDVGHQTYAWKILTGRRKAFSSLRRKDGISGFCNPEETVCDAFVSGHAGNALAAAEGFAEAARITGSGCCSVAVVGDASLANGESFEALNRCASLKGKVILVVNDNGPSVSRNGGPAEKSAWPGDGIFGSFGMRCIGPVDGHDIKAMESAFEDARSDGRSVAVHVVTVKGKGFAPAEADPAAWHSVGAFDLASSLEGALPRKSAGAGWSDAFGDALCRFAERDNRICALTAAMPDGTGLAGFAEKFPDRFFDVGICESLLVTFAAGLAKAGMRPVVAVYSSFLQRAVDQVMHDVCILKLPVVLCIDRAGAVGEDGRTHHGMFDIAMLRCLPGLVICQPRDTAELEAMLGAALSSGGPWAIRYPRGAAIKDRIAGIEVHPGKAEQISGEGAPVQIWALGDRVERAREVADLLAEKGISAGIVNARFVKPFDAALLERQRAGGAVVVSMENGSVQGGFGEAIGADLRFGWPDVFIGHGKTSELEEDCGLSPPAVAAKIASFLAKRARRS